MNDCHFIPQLSIVTPTYNRAALLARCYDSLAAQSCKDYEWIVVDDGSSDDTQQIIQKLQETEDGFPIQYIKKDNGGKHTALNASHPYLNGKYVLILDSDDLLKPDAVETVLREWKVYESQDEIGILIFLRETPDNKLCAYVKDERTPVDLLHYPRIHVVSTDCCEVLRTELFTNHPFPVFPGERFLGETALWYRVGAEKKVVYINTPVYVCEYLEGGLTRSGRSMRVKNPYGGMYTSELRMDCRCSWKERIRAGLLYVCYGRYARLGVGDMLRRTAHKGLIASCLLPGTCMYLLWKRKY